MTGGLPPAGLGGRTLNPEPGRYGVYQDSRGYWTAAYSGRQGVDVRSYLNKADAERAYNVFKSGVGTIPPNYIIGAARGFHGMVTTPTGFLAGERGRERVNITPRNQMATYHPERQSSGNSYSVVILSLLVRALREAKFYLNGREITEGLKTDIFRNIGNY